MQSIDDLKAKQAQELAKLEAEHKFAALLPFEPSYIALSCATGTPRVSFKVEGLGGALEALKAFTVVPFTEYRNGGLHLKPVALCEGADPDRHSDQWAVSLVAETDFLSHLGYPLTTVKLKFFARVPGVIETNGIVRVTLDIQGPDHIGGFNALAATCAFTGKGSGRHIERNSKAPNLALNGYCDRVISYGGMGDNRAYYVYLIHSDYADQDCSGSKELSHLYGQLQNMADEFDNKECA